MKSTGELCRNRRSIKNSGEGPLGIKRKLLYADYRYGMMKQNHLKLRKSRTVLLLTLAVISGWSLSAQEGSSYTVKAGDTIYSIARSFAVSPSSLMDANEIDDPRMLKIGEKLIIPSSYVVEKGDTLFSIARNHGMTVQQLCDANGISETAILKTGTVLRIPPDSRMISRLDQQNEAISTESWTKENEDQDEDPDQIKPPEQGTDALFAAEAVAVSWPHKGDRRELTGKLKGIEISGKRGDEIVAVNSGNVVWVAPYRGYGRLVMVEGVDNTIYAYGGNEETFVQVGDRVESGMVIGKLGLHPVEKEAKVFFFVYKNGKALDPVRAPRG